MTFWVRVAVYAVVGLFVSAVLMTVGFWEWYHAAVMLSLYGLAVIFLPKWMRHT